jgi:hypothetical protein
MENRNINVNQKRLRELAERVPEIVSRQVGAYPLLASFTATLVPLAAAFVERYDRLRRQHVSVRETLASGRQRVAELEAQLRILRSRLAADVEAFAEGARTGRSRSPDETFADARHVIETVSERSAALSYGAELIADFSAVLEGARTEWSAAQAALVELQMGQAELRAQNIALVHQLSKFRRMLRALVGTQHRDYQRLRPTRTKRGDEDDPDSAQEPAVVTEGGSVALPTGATQANGTGTSNGVSVQVPASQPH